MFTGIIRHVGEVLSAAGGRGGTRLRIDVGLLAETLAPGDSVSVNGACLTAATVDGARAEFDVVAETLSRTTLGALRRGSRVNLEPAAALGETLDGHLVQGHVDAVARVERAGGEGEWLLGLSTGTAVTDTMIPRGSVAIDGVSLTIAELADGRFRIALIPTTLAETTLGDLGPGDRVNVETDVLGKYVRRYLRAAGAESGGLTLEKLRDAGFA